MAAVSDRIDGRSGKGERSQNTSDWKGPIRITEFNSQQAKNTSRISRPEEWASTLTGNIEYFPCQQKYRRHFSHKLHGPRQAAGSWLLFQAVLQHSHQHQVGFISSASRMPQSPHHCSCSRQKMGLGVGPPRHRTENRHRAAHSECRQANSK